MLRLSKELSVE